MHVGCSLLMSVLGYNPLVVKFLVVLHDLGLLEVLVTGGIPPRIQEVCSADSAVTATYKRVITQNNKFCKCTVLFPVVNCTHSSRCPWGSCHVDLLILTASHA